MITESINNPVPLALSREANRRILRGARHEPYCVHFGAIPIFCERGKPTAQIGRLRFINSPLSQID
jgi:hypothetical protein